jgi:chromosome segregation ATPase
MAEEEKGMDIENIDALKEKLVAVSTEIDAIKNSFSKSAEDLSRIQGMLTIGKLDDLSSIINKFETRVAEVEKKRVEASEGAKKYSEELEKEKERLIKLWDAYKNQEEELSVTEKKVAEYKEKIRTSEATQKHIEDDFTARINTLTQKLTEYEEKEGQVNDYKLKCEEFDNIRNELEREIHDLKEQNSTNETIINDLNQQIVDLRGRENYEEYKEKYEEVSAEYEKEKERLTKLYQLYEETEAECNKLKNENKNWQNWYNTNKEISNKLFSSGPPFEIETSVNTPIEQTPKLPTTDNENTEKKPKIKRKLKFRK